MEETAIAGRGTYTYIADDSEAESKMKKLFSKIELPALTDIKITGQGLTDIVPKQVPDLYSGETLSIAMAVNDPKSKLFIEGRVGDELWKSELDIRHTSSDQGVATNWARSMITSLERHNYTGLSQERTKEKVTELGLAFHQVTPYTSLVAVDVTPIRTDNNKSVKSDIPLDKPNGLSISLAQTSTGYFKSLMFGLFLAIASILALAFDSRKKAVNAANTKNTFGG
jgi:Ca-activated chloride channel family protein